MNTTLNPASVGARRREIGGLLDAAVAALCGLMLGLRLLNADDSLSYDYAAYIYYFDVLSDTDFSEIISNAKDLFPYVVLSGVPIFEIGYVLVAKSVLWIAGSSSVAYAAIAAYSSGMRVYLLRRLGCSWPWIVVLQLYSVTLFEANAMRLGLAVTLVIAGLYKLSHERRTYGIGLMLVSIFVHLQSGLFVVPFFAAWIMRRKLERSRGTTAALLALMFATLALVLASGILTSHEKLGDYADKESGSAGFTVTSILAIIFALYSLFWKAPLRMGHKQASLIWTAALVAMVPSLMIFVAVTSIAALGDRAWQFAFVMIAALVHTDWSARPKHTIAVVLLWLIAITSVVNVTIRYPLSNVFDFILPTVVIAPPM